MDKVTINHQVVQMRKFVKQAKIRAINNYTKEIRLLQNQKGNEDETSKHKRKAERLIAKVGILKKIQPDTVSKKALSKEKNWKAVLKEKNIPLEDQCYALLANYAGVQSEVEKFHNKHCDLVSKIPTLFKDWEKKSKDPINKQQRKEAKKLHKNIKLDLLEIKKTCESEDEKFKNTFDSTSEKVEEKKITPWKKSPLKLQVEKTSQDIQSRLMALSNNSQKVDMRRNRQVKGAMDEKAVSRNKLKVVTVLNLNDIQDFDEIPIEKTNEVSEETGGNKRKEDPFFMGRGGEAPSESEEDDSVNPGQEMDHPALKNRKGKPEKFKKHLQKTSPLKKSAIDDKPLHPSWEAKKKLKTASNSKFQGKRIVFHD